jgi:uncharacterized protein YkwD
VRLAGFAISFALVAAACAPMSAQRPGAALAPDGRPLPTVYRLSGVQPSRVQFRLLDGVNALRASQGLAKLELSPELNAAGMTHARDMAVQNRPWNFGSDGSSPIDRAQRAGYAGRLIGENISETFENELEALANWMDVPSQRAVIMDPDARFLGLGWHQEANGKIWWTMLTGA